VPNWILFKINGLDKIGLVTEGNYLRLADKFAGQNFPVAQTAAGVRAGDTGRIKGGKRGVSPRRRAGLNALFTPLS
jgi:hypothetical protein